MQAEATIENPDVEAVFNHYPAATRRRLLTLRQLILDTAAATPGVGRLEETLKWGQISYLTPETSSGTTIRIDATNDGVALFVNCRTDLLARYRAIYPTQFGYAGDRAVLLRDDRAIDMPALGHCIALALTYHRRPRNT